MGRNPRLAQPLASGSAELAELIGATSWIDTHEHLVREAARTAGSLYEFVDVQGARARIPDDWTALVAHYVDSDLLSAGLPPERLGGLYGDELGAEEKWDLIAPVVDAIRDGGYWRAAELSSELLFEERLDRESCGRIGEKLRALGAPGYYERVLRDFAGVERCQVNSLDVEPFCPSEAPGLLDQDLSISGLALGRHPRAERLSGIEGATLASYLEMVEWCFEEYGGEAVAVKCAWAYDRPLGIGEGGDPPRRQFERMRRGEASLAEERQVQDHVFGRCLDLAGERDLPVKLHLGHLAGTANPRFASVFDHVREVTPLVQARPGVRFVLMHAAWPDSERLLALAKHQPNVTVDLCWSWILAPAATVEFVKRFITLAPTNKLLCFGGDYLTVENVVGHAALARRGLGLALEGLVAEGWLSTADAIRLVPELMRGNANRTFYESACSRPS